MAELGKETKVEELETEIVDQKETGEDDVFDVDAERQRVFKDHSVGGDNKELVETPTIAKDKELEEKDKKETDKAKDPEPEEGKKDKDFYEDKDDSALSIENLRRDNVRLSGHNSQLQNQLNEIDSKAKVVRQAREPVLDENGVFTDSFTQLKQEFPEADFGRVEDIITRQQQQIDQLVSANEQTTGDIQQAREQSYRTSQVALVTARHPDANEVRGSEEFAKWHDSLPPEEQRAMKTWDAGVISISLDRFKAATGFKSKATKEAESHSLAEKTTDKRKKRESASIAVKTKQPAVPVTGGGDTFDVEAEKQRVYKNLGVN